MGVDVLKLSVTSFLFVCLETCLFSSGFWIQFFKAEFTSKLSCFSLCEKQQTWVIKKWVICESI